MKNTNALQIFSILSVIIIFVLLILIYVFTKDSSMRTDQMNAAIEKAKAAETTERQAKQDMIMLKELIGHGDEVSIQAIQDAFNKDMEKYAKGTAQNYRLAISNLDNELKRKADEQKNTADSFNDLKVNFDNLNAMYETIVDQYAEERAKAVNDLASAREDFSGNLAKQKQEMDVIKSERDRIEQEAEEKIKDATAKADQESIKARQTSLRNKELADVIGEIRRDSFDRPDGKIVSVNQKAGLAVIDLGSDDGLMTRMTFSVYNPAITGISFGSLKLNDEATICEVCKRDASLNASKASVEVVRIIGPHKAEVRILQDQLTNPIVAGDVIHTPIWKPGQKQRFALASGMRLPGVGNRDGGAEQSSLENIKRLIAANGGIVDSYISDGSEKDHKRGEIVGDITRDTTYLVVGDLDDDDQQDQEIMESQSKMINTAEQLAVKQITLRDLLSRMAYKNVTPVRGFGKYADEGDHGIQAIGGIRPSTGTTTPLYQLPNDKVRVTNKDRMSRPSNGTFSGLYQDTPSSSQSTGGVSDLFRPRKPGSTPSAKDDAE